MNEFNDFKDFIKIALDYYDEQKLSYSFFSKTTKPQIKLDNNNIKIYDDNKILYYGEYEFLGYLDLKTNIWHWSWLVPSINSKYTQLAKDLLNYALKLDNTDTNEHYYIRLLLLNSRLIIKYSFEQDINMAICSYLLKDKIKFIYPVEEQLKIKYFLIL